MSTLTEHTMLEIWWTILPGVVLVFIAVPSLNLLYFIDEVRTPDLTVNTLGHQWYWEYNYPDFNNIGFEAYMLRGDNNASRTRLLDVDNRVVVPTTSLIRVLVRAADVLHS